MLVGERMTSNPVTTGPKISVPEALNIMRIENIRRLPVVDDAGVLMGIVSEKDLLNASPSPATSLSVWEINYLLSKLTVKDVMERNVITITEDECLENAARIMADNKIGGLPVMRGNDLVGIITETDLFKVFIELFSAREKGVRIVLRVAAVIGELAKITATVANRGGNILALGTFLGDDPGSGLITMKVVGISQEDLVKELSPIVQEIVDIRAT